MYRDGPKPLGRFFKKNSRNLGFMDVVEYRFDIISKEDSIFSDNPGGNIFRHRLHDQKNFKKNVTSPTEFHDSLVDESNRLPIIQPRDFTGDWLEERNKAKKRTSQNYLDDDDFEMAIEEEQIKKELDRQARQKKEESPSDLEENTPNIGAVHQDPIEVSEDLQQKTESEPVLDSDENLVTDKADHQDKTEDDHESIDQRIKEAYDQGYQEAKTTLAPKEQAESSESQAAVDDLKASLAGMIEKVENKANAALSENRETLAKRYSLALHALGRVFLKRELTRDPELWKNIIDHLQKDDRFKSSVHIEVSPNIKDQFDKMKLELPEGWAVNQTLDTLQVKIAGEEGAMLTGIDELAEDILRDLDDALSKD